MKINVMFKSVVDFCRKLYNNSGKWIDRIAELVVGSIAAVATVGLILLTGSLWTFVLLSVSRGEILWTPTTVIATVWVSLLFLLGAFVLGSWSVVSFNDSVVLPTWYRAMLFASGAIVLAGIVGFFTIPWGSVSTWLDKDALEYRESSQVGNSGQMTVTTAVVPPLPTAAAPTAAATPTRQASGPTAFPTASPTTFAGSTRPARVVYLPGDDDYLVYTNAWEVRFRLSPGLDGKPIEGLHKDLELEVVGYPTTKDDIQWVPVRVRTGYRGLGPDTYGWVALKLLRLQR